MALVNKRLFDHDPQTGITEYYYDDTATGGFVIEQVQDVTEIIELNKAKRNDDTGRFRDLHQISSMPLTILMQLAKEGIVTMGFKILDEKRWRAWLNDPDNEAWRTKRCRV